MVMLAGCAYLPPMLSIQSHFIKICGWEAYDLHIDGVPYTIFKVGSQVIGGMMEVPKNNPNNLTPHWMSYITVTSIDQKIKEAKEHGAEFSTPIFEIPGFGKGCLIQDPMGIYIGLYQPE